VRPALHKTQHDDLLLVGRQALHRCPYALALQFLCHQPGRVGFRVAVQLDIQRSHTQRMAAVVVGDPVVRHAIQVGAQVLDRSHPVACRFQEAIKSL